MKLIRKVLMEVFGKDWLKVYERWLRKVEDGTGVRSQLSITLDKANGKRYDFGVVSEKMITNAGIESFRRAIMGIRPNDNAAIQYRWFIAYQHAVGTGTNPESPTDTALQNQVAGWNNPGNYNYTFDDATRTLTIISVASFTFSSSYSITEHGVRGYDLYVDQPSALFDRSVFADNPIAVNSGDVLNTDYKLRFQF